jgi:hypothetical protein
MLPVHECAIQLSRILGVHRSANRNKTWKKYASSKTFRSLHGRLGVEELHNRREGLAGKGETKKVRPQVHRFLWQGTYDKLARPRSHELQPAPPQLQPTQQYYWFQYRFCFTCSATQPILPSCQTSVLLGNIFALCSSLTLSIQAPTEQQSSKNIPVLWYLEPLKAGLSSAHLNQGNTSSDFQPLIPQDS